MSNYSIVFTNKNVTEVIDKPIPEPGAGEVVVKLAYSTVSSGTERANLSGNPNISIHDANLPVVFPKQLGYSSSGYVYSVGAGVTGVKPGDRVAVSWSVHSQYTKVTEGNVHKLDDGTPLNVAAMAMIATFPMAAIRKCRLEMGEPAVVMGQGILGMFAVALLHAGGATPVVAVDPIAEKRANALRIGADYAFDPFEPGFQEKVREVTHGGAKVGIEVTGNGKGLDGILDCMARFGRVALLGCTRSSDFTIDYYRKVHGPGISLIGAHTQARPAVESSPGMWTHHDDVMAVLRLNDSGRLDLAGMVAEVHSPAEAPEVYGRLLRESAFPIVQFDWGKMV